MKKRTHKIKKIAAYLDFYGGTLSFGCKYMFLNLLSIHDCYILGPPLGIHTVDNHLWSVTVSLTTLSHSWNQNSSPFTYYATCVVSILLKKKIQHSWFVRFPIFLEFIKKNYC